MNQNALVQRDADHLLPRMARDVVRYNGRRDELGDERVEDICRAFFSWLRHDAALIDAGEERTLIPTEDGLRQSGDGAPPAPRDAGETEANTGDHRSAT